MDGKAVKSGAASEGIDVSKPNTKITIAVKSKDGRTTLNYEIDCTNVPPSTDATLKELAVAPGGLDPKFDPKVRTFDQRLATASFCAQNRPFCAV